MKTILILAATCGLMATSFANAAGDDEAEAVLKKSACMTCHAVDKKKIGTSFKEVAKKFKGKADAEATLTKHLTTKPMVEMDGKKMEHVALKSNDASEIRSAVKWILSR